MQLFKNRIIQTVLLGCGAMLMFSMISYMLFIHAFPVDREKEIYIKKFEQVRENRAEYYRKHPHDEINEK
ncbi:hypothetical protein ACRBU7_03930 [Priestia aryabhattai]|uniref:hypothetical protein n=1 Tax=Priestia aryabhattai TaxID=412384 RepID=UPI003D7F9F79